MEKKRAHRGGERPYRYFFPPLGEMRAKFGAMFSTQPDWDLGRDWHPADALLSVATDGTNAVARALLA